jgi:hypothetical protein
MAHPLEADHMGKAARQRVLRLFTWDAAVDECLEAYREARECERSSWSRRRLWSDSSSSSFC